MIVDTGKMSGVLRAVDHLGRFCMPAEFRKTLGINPGDYLEIFLLEDGALLVRPQNAAAAED